MTSFQSTVWVIGAGILQSYLIEEIQEMGLCCLATDGNPHAQGFSLADEYATISTYDIQKHVSLAHDIPHRYPWMKIIGICTAGADVAPTVAHVAHELGLPCIDPMVADMSHDKSRVRAALSLSTHTVDYQPRWKNAYTHELPHQIMDGIGFPAVVKPLEQRASRGVSIVKNYHDLLLGIEKVSPYGSHFLIEECMEGTEHSAEVLFNKQGDVVYFNVTDRLFCYDNGIALEIGAMSPTALPQESCDAIKAMLLRSAKVIGVNFGAWKCDVMMTSSGPKIIECTARLSGGFDAQWLAPFTGRHPLRRLIEISCDMSINGASTTYDMDHADGYAGVFTIIPRKGGRVISLENPNGVSLRGSLSEDTDMCEVIWNVQPGDIIAPPTHLGERIGFLLVHAETYRSVVEGGLRTAKSLAWGIEVSE